MESPMPFSVALERYQAIQAEYMMATKDLIAAAQAIIDHPSVDRQLDFCRIITALQPVSERGVTESTRRNLNTAIAIATNAIEART